MGTLHMDFDGSVTGWIGDLKGGDPDAAQKLWERYFESVVRLARARLRSARHVGTVDDEEDAALSVLNGVFDGLSCGKFPQLTDRDGLWRLLVVVTARKSLSQARDARRQKRGGGRVRTEADLGAADDDALLAGVIGAEPSPEFAAMMAEVVRRRLDALGDVTLRRVAEWRLEGYELEEIAARLGCGTRTVKRQLGRIREAWQEQPRD
jgi:DNA-directed RNA polymerase specialized sigma24 family protein